jgi:diguanylate cyclase (GGDEF)-like protein/PAS domain S-box-containing protein
MSPFNFTTIRDKLVAITMVSCVVSLLVAGTAMILYSWESHKENTINRLHVLSTVLGDRSKAALVFDDTTLISENLQSLRFEPGVLLACIYSNNSLAEGLNLAGQYLNTENQKQKCPPKPLSTIDVTSDHSYDRFGNIYVHRSIIFENEKLGEIIIHSDHYLITQKVLLDALIISLIIILGITVAYLLIRNLQRYISVPIQQLSKTATLISSRNDASIRARQYSNDETGKLVSAFNDMLDTIEQQNDSLTIVKNNYLALYDKNPMMLFTLDMNGTIISVNEYGAMHLGKDSDEILNTDFYNLVFDADIESSRHFINECMDNYEQVQRKEIRVNDINEKTIWTRSTARSIVNENGEQNILIVCEDITEQKKLSEKLSFQASHDALTGLVNRREFEQRINRTIKMSQDDSEQEHALFFLDLDQFKIINDTCGHLAGDHLLRELVALINPIIRQGDTLARIGGDEFGVLLENCAINQAAHVAEQIKQKIYEYKFIWDNKELSVGVSIGVVPINSSTSSITIAMSDADAACYIAKESGRNKIHIYKQGDEEIANRHGEMTWVNRIQEALNNDHFVLLAQAITPTDDIKSSPKHFEILIRMLDTEDNMISPGQFLPAAERYNLSPEIDRWVVSNTFKWFNENQQQLESIDLCSINLSGNTLSDEGFSDFLLQQFAQYEIPSEKVCFEITETSAISNLDIAQRFIHSFSNELRCRFSLDDFGTGLSSFAYLKNMPVDFIKIDGQFVRDITNDPIDMAMVRSINEIGQIMGKKTVAEFVENEQILKQLKLIGIDYVQGYYISKPVPLDQLAGSQDIHSRKGQKNS